MQSSFNYESLPIRVTFQPGGLSRIADEVRGIGKAALILCTPEQCNLAGEIAALLSDAAVGVFDQATMHVPMDVVRSALSETRRLGADCCVAVGGGSTIGLGKAIALEMGLPIVAIPTTYAGSEMTPIWGVTENGLKKTGRDFRVLPKSVIYDPRLTLSLPPTLSASSGMNSIAHAVEALYAQNANPVISMLSTECIRILMLSLPKVVTDPNDIEARSEALYGAWLGGIALGSVGMALHHKICHTLGGTFNLPHAETHSIVLPHVVRFNQSSVASLRARIGSTEGDSLAEQLAHLLLKLELKTRLKDIGMREDDLPRAAELILNNPYYNPRAVTPGSLQTLLGDAFWGVGMHSDSATQ